MRAVARKFVSQNFFFQVIQVCCMDLLRHVHLEQVVPRSVAIKTTTQLIHNLLCDTQATNKWSPTPQEIIESNDDINTNLFNLISWIVHPRDQISNNGRVMLHKSKAQKVLQITQNITALLPNTLPSKDQVLLSLTMHRKTGSRDV